MSEDKNIPNFAEMSDEDIMNMDPFAEGGLDSKEATPPETGDVAPETSEEGDLATPGEAGGAEHPEGTNDLEADGSDSAAEGGEGDTPTQEADSDLTTPEGDQPTDTVKSDTSATSGDSDETDYKALYEELMAPFKAARREVKLDNIEDARRLLQMGVDYSNKMRQMKPHLRVLRTLEKAGLTDPDEINFLLDVRAKNPEAIKKLLKDGSIDPMDLDLEGSSSYKPTEHVIGDVELNLAEAFNSISDSPKYQDTLTTLDAMDTLSKQQLQDNPSVIPVINQHIEAGIYDKVWAKVEMERMLGRLPGLSDLDAYYKVGEAMHQAGLFGDPQAKAAPSTPSSPAQASAQGNGSPAGKTDNRNDQRRAASPTRGRAAQGGKKVPDFSKMSDSDIEKLDISSLL